MFDLVERDWFELTIGKNNFIAFNFKNGNAWSWFVTIKNYNKNDNHSTLIIEKHNEPIIEISNDNDEVEDEILNEFAKNTTISFTTNQQQVLLKLHSYINKKSTTIWHSAKVIQE